MDMMAPMTLFISFFVLVFAGVPISFSIGTASILSIMTMLPVDTAIMLISQNMVRGLNSFSLLAIPFFILAGIMMNRGGIAIRLINFSQILVGRMPGALAHVNIMANMMFGSISGSAVAAAAAVGGVMTPEQKKAGYDPAFSAAVNAASCPTGLLIPPSNVMIIYSLSSGGVSIAALFLAGYLPGLLMGLSMMAVAAVFAMRNNYPVAERPTLRMAVKAFLDAVPSLFLVLVVMGGIIGGIFTATEASAIAVVYTFVLSVLIYKEIKISDLPSVILESVVTSSIVLLLISVSVAMSWAMTNADLPFLISDALLAISENPIVIMLIINIILLMVGIFMDMTPAVLIFTPIFLPIVTQMGVDPLHFGIIMIFNLCIGLVTPPVGSALFVGCSVSGVKIQDMIKPMIPLYIALFITLLMVTFIPDISLIIPRLLGFI